MTALGAYTIRLELPDYFETGHLVALARSWFDTTSADMSSVSEVNSSHSDELRPYTVSILRRSSLSATLRMTTLTEPLTLGYNELLPTLVGTNISLGGQGVHIVSVETQTCENLWSGQDTSAELVRRCTLSDLPRTLELEFDSPTAFKSTTGLYTAFPTPELVFGSLLERWNAFSDVQLHSDLRRFAVECVAVSRYRLQSVSSPILLANHKLRIAGCQGRCRYVFVKGDHYWRGLINLLANYAFYAGIGVRTTSGMGRSRRLEPTSVS